MREGGGGREGGGRERGRREGGGRERGRRLCTLTLDTLNTLTGLFLSAMSFNPRHSEHTHWAVSLGYVL